MVHTADWENVLQAPSAAIAEGTFFGNRRVSLGHRFLEDGCVSRGALRVPFAETAAILWPSETQLRGKVPLI